MPDLIHVRATRRSASGRCLLFIGAPGFEPGTSPTRTVRATRLRHAPRPGDYPSIEPAAAPGLGNSVAPLLSEPHSQRSVLGITGVFGRATSLGKRRWLGRLELTGRGLIFSRESPHPSLVYPIFSEPNPVAHPTRSHLLDLLNRFENLLQAGRVLEHLGPRRARNDRRRLGAEPQIGGDAVLLFELLDDLALGL